MTAHRMFLWLLAGTASLLLAILAYVQGDPMATIGLIFTPLCLLALVIVLLDEYKEGR